MVNVVFGEVPLPLELFGPVQLYWYGAPPPVNTVTVTEPLDWAQAAGVVVAESVTGAGPFTVTQVVAVQPFPSVTVTQ